MIRLIAAIDNRRGIAKDGAMPWDLVADRLYFQTQTKKYGGVVLMGFWTFNSLSQPLPGRKNYVLTHKKNLSFKDITLVNNLEKFLMLNDVRTCACEVPVWLQPTDFVDYDERFKTSFCITGHIDILRVEEGGMIGIWDYKPGACNEKRARE